MKGQRPDLLVPALVGGAFLGVTSALPILEMLNCACCGLIITGGMLASYLYLRDYPAHLPPPRLGDGALVGLLSGVVGWVVYAVVTIPLQFVKSRLGIDEEDLAQIREALNDPSIPEGLREILAQLFHGGQFSIGVIFVSLLAFLLIATIFGTIGGILGMALMQRRQPPVAPPADGV